MRVQYLFILILFTACGRPATEQDPASPPARGSRAGSNQPPNIIYILADDLGYGDLAIYNPDSKIPTPNLDRLAAEGMRFTDMHSPSSVCTPTRYGILTGRYCWRSRLPQGVLRGYGRSLIEPDRRTVAALLQEHGYHTGVIGKWHLGLDWVLKEGREDALEDESTSMNDLGIVTEMNPDFIDFSRKPTDGPLNHGFDYSFILPASLDMDPYCYLENDSLTAIPDQYTPGNDLNTGYTGAFWRAGRIASGFEFDQVLPTFTQKALDYLEQRSAEDGPFFLYMPLAAPHTPWVPTAEFAGTAGAGTYGDFVHMVDAAVGQVLQKLRELDQEENTLVIFTSDNGPFWTPALIEQYEHRAAGSLRGMKADAWEGGHRIPFIVRWPGKVQAGSQNEALSTLTNLMSTCAGLLGVALGADEGEDSFSILPVLLGEENEVAGQPAVVHHSSRGFFAIRRGDWKLILGRGSGGFSEPRVVEPQPGEATGQLYNLAQDPAETSNAYREHPEVVQELSGLLRKFQEEGRSRNNETMKQ
jgi:arylsulfatase A-like enzyme